MARFLSGLAARTGKSHGSKAKKRESGPICLVLCYVWLALACPKGNLTLTCI